MSKFQLWFIIFLFEFEFYYFCNIS